MAINKYFHQLFKKLLSFLMEVKPICPFVSPDGVCRAFEKTGIYIEVIPRMITDIVCDPFNQVADRSRPENDTLGYKSLNDAVIDSENIALSLLHDVKSENLFFIFGQTIESLNLALIEFPFLPPSFGPLCEFNEACSAKECEGKNQNDTQPRAIILCKLQNTQFFENAFRTEQQKGCGGTKRYEITWGELQKIKQKFCD